MIVAAGTIDGYATRGGHHLRDHVIEVVGTGQALQHRTGRFCLTDKIPWARRQKPCGCYSFRIIGAQKITSQLIGQKAIVRHIGIKGPDQPVAVSPRVFTLLISFKSMCVGVVGNIKPLASLPFTITWRCQISIHQSGESIGVWIFLECCHLFRTGRQTKQVERQPADKGVPVGTRTGRDIACLKLRINERIDSRTRHRHQRLPSPVIQSWVPGKGAFSFGLRPCGAFIDPCADQINLRSA